MTETNGMDPERFELLKAIVQGIKNFGMVEVLNLIGHALIVIESQKAITGTGVEIGPGLPGSPS